MQVESRAGRRRFDGRRRFYEQASWP